MQLQSCQYSKPSGAGYKHHKALPFQANKKFHWFDLLTIILLIVLVSVGCESQQSKSDRLLGSKTMPADEGEQQLWLAERRQSSDRVEHLLKALEIYYDREDYETSQKIINRILPEPLNSEQYQSFAVLAGRVAVDMNDGNTALLLLDNAPPDTFNFAPPEVLATITELRSEALFVLGDYLNSAKNRALNSGLFTGADYRRNMEEIWRSLKKAENSEVKLALEETANEYNYNWRGWLELISAINQHQTSLDMQHSALEQWLAIWTDHDASQQIPADLQMLRNFPEIRPRKIALALPLTGRFGNIGQAIRDGFLAAYYQDKISQSETTEISIFDTNAYSNAIDLYLEIQLQSYDLFIGPLKKESVREFSGLPQLMPPVLALNYLDTQSEPVDGLYQFGLSADDEINQILNLLDQQGKKRLAIIQQDLEWARKLIPPIMTWAQQRGFPEPLVYQFDNTENLSDGLAGFLEISASVKRAHQLRNLVGKIEFEPRRREDIDASILLALPAKAQQIKPLLAFHYASDIPLYAPSRVFSGISHPSENRDLDGILYTEIPWLLNNTTPIKKSIQYLSGSNAYQRLYAMGADAHNLASHLPLLKSFPHSIVQGHTGNLTVNGKLQIRRQLEWATFEAGKIKPQPNINLQSKL